MQSGGRVNPPPPGGFPVSMHTKSPAPKGRVARMTLESAGREIGPAGITMR